MDIDNRVETVGGGVGEGRRGYKVDECQWKNIIKNKLFIKV